MMFADAVGMTKSRFYTLDGMRGLAALLVVYYHSTALTSATCTTFKCNVPFGYLAVDLFFALSGFVIAYSYDKRLSADLSAVQFMKIRIVRLYPLFLAASVIGLVPLFQHFRGGTMSPIKLLATLATDFLMLPTPGAARRVLFPMVPPAWSLFMELFVANLSYAVTFCRQTTRNLIVAILLSLVLLAVAVRHQGDANIGSDWATLPGGIARVMFSFYVGVLLARIRSGEAAFKVPGWLILAALAASMFATPFARFGIAYELFCIALLFPGLIYAGSWAGETRPRLGAVLGAVLGDVSYAVYLFHYPLLLVLLSTDIRSIVRPGPLLFLPFLAAVVGIAYAADRWFDRPARLLLAGIVGLRGTPPPPRD